MSALILVVEDDPTMLAGIRDNLEIDGYRVHAAADGKMARVLFAGAAPDLVLLDRMLPDVDGAALCREFRRKNEGLPIIMLTARGEEMDRVLGFEMGADDYVVKPFSILELLARIKVQLKRKSVPKPQVLVQRIGAAEVDFRRHQVLRQGKPLEISAKELDLLRYLAEHRGQVVSREQLLSDVWGYQSDVSSRTVDTFVARLRKKVEFDPAHPAVLITVHGLGYKLVDDNSS